MPRLKNVEREPCSAESVLPQALGGLEKNERESCSDEEGVQISRSSFDQLGAMMFGSSWSTSMLDSVVSSPGTPRPIHSTPFPAEADNSFTVDFSAKRALRLSESMNDSNQEIEVEDLEHELKRGLEERGRRKPVKARRRYPQLIQKTPSPADDRVGVDFNAGWALKLLKSVNNSNQEIEVNKLKHGLDERRQPRLIEKNNLM